MTLIHLFGVEAYETPRLAERAERRGFAHTGRIRQSTVVTTEALAAEVAEEWATRLHDRLTQAHSREALVLAPWARAWIVVRPLPGTTDDRARAAEGVAQHLLERAICVCTASIYEIENALPMSELRALAEALFGNPLVDELHVGHDPHALSELLRRERALPQEREVQIEAIALPSTDEELLQLSRARELSLSTAELRAIAAYFAEHRAERAALGLPGDPTDAELEMLAQTWSEHCKHKEFRARIEMEDRTIDSLFDSTIVRATEEIRAALASEGASWLLSVFADNAGVVAFDDEHAFVLKVETHNSPSALDPYGGAMTGILGNQRDPLGTGRGGAHLLFNTNVLCFGPLDYDAPLLPGQLHPRVIYEGVLAGIRDGGNQTGVPTVNGAVLFDPRYAGKPLVYCGSGALSPRRDAHGAPLYEKDVRPGDLVIMVGGRVGADGIHGATFSSRTMDEHAPRSVVQIGSPITQKRVADWLADVAPRGLFSAVTDNGAGGLASSVGELAVLCGGARIDLAKVPLKSVGLQPWEILVSESQERMTIAARPQHFAALAELARVHDVELSVLGCFDDSGRFRADYDALPVCDLELSFLHDGWPRLTLPAILEAPPRKQLQHARNSDLSTTLLALLASPNVCSRERIVRRYDHEVQARTVLKPYMEHAPQDAAVLRVGMDADYSGIAIASGIAPRYGDLDPYQASACAFDEAVRSVIAVGARLPFGESVQDFVCACDNFCMPDVRFDPTHNPDGPHKLGKLVRMAEALYDVARCWRVPLVSGKDSMKNDLRAAGVKISAPPTVLFTVACKLRDVRRVVSAELKNDGDRLYLLEASAPQDHALGGTGLGASELAARWGMSFGAVPRVDVLAARALYWAMGEAHARRVLASCHDLSDGGLAVALAEVCLGGGRGARVTMPKRESALAEWFGEAPSRFLVSVQSAQESALREIFGARAHYLGEVGGEVLQLDDHAITLSALRAAYEGNALP